MAFQADGNIMIGGVFTSYDGTGRNRIARIISDISTATSAVAIQNNTVFPNPSEGTFSITSTIAGPVEVTVTDPVGKFVLSKHVQSVIGQTFTLDLADRSAGVYIMTIHGQDKTSTARLVLH